MNARLDFGRKLTMLVAFVCFSMVARGLSAIPSGSDREGIGRSEAENKSLIDPASRSGKTSGSDL